MMCFPYLDALSISSKIWRQGSEGLFEFTGKLVPAPFGSARKVEKARWSIDRVKRISEVESIDRVEFH